MYAHYHLSDVPGLETARKSREIRGKSRNRRSNSMGFDGQMPSVNAVNHKSSLCFSQGANGGGGDGDGSWTRAPVHYLFWGSVAYPSRPHFPHFLWLTLDLSQLSVGQVRGEVFFYRFMRVYWRFPRKGAGSRRVGLKWLAWQVAFPAPMVESICGLLVCCLPSILHAFSRAFPRLAGQTFQLRHYFLIMCTQKPHANTQNPHLFAFEWFSLFCEDKIFVQSFLRP